MKEARSLAMHDPLRWKMVRGRFRACPLSEWRADPNVFRAGAYSWVMHRRK
jgi:hypothetical protein